MITLVDIEAARRRVEDSIFLSPCSRSEHFSRLTGTSAFFKLENLQATGSFKERGALNKLLSLSPEERARGVITASAGNHAQAVASHAGRLGIGATVLMPESTPLIKVQSCRGFGARVILHGSGYDDAYAEAVRIAQAEDRVMVHPFDDDLVIAGQGTIGLELLEQNPYLDVVVVPIGGGGLISGIAIALKEINPRVRVVGVETAAVPRMKASREAGRIVTVEGGRTIADGIAVKKPGERTFAVVQKYVDDLVAVSEEEIANAILLLLEREKTVVEGSGAVSLAAVLNGKVPGVEGRKVVMVLSGGNIDVNMLARIIERGLVKEGRLVRLVVTVLDRPGSLARLTALMAERRANVMEIHHDRTFTRAAMGETEIEMTLETRGREHIEELLAALRAAGYAVREEIA